MHAINRRRGTLVELPGDELHGKIPLACEVALVSNGVRYTLAKDAVTALLQQFWRESEQVIDAEVAQLLQVELQVLVEFLTQALCLNAERFFFLDKDTIVCHGS